MARQKKSRYYPVQSKIDLINPSGETGTNWIAIAPNLLSMINRRHYPASGVYDVKMDLKPIGTDTSVQIFALKDNWDTIGAIRLAYKMYQRATKDERELRGSSVARWEDFRINHGTGYPECVPAVYSTTGGILALSLGQFLDSQVVDDAGLTKRFVVQGASTAVQYNIMDQWNASGSVDTQPQVLGTGDVYPGLDNNDTGQANILVGNGNQPPYDQTGDDGIGNPWTLVATLGQGGSNTGTMSSGFFRAPLGMVLIVSTNTPNNLTMTVREGSHKGIKVHDILG